MMLMWGPGNSFDGCHVAGEAVEGVLRQPIPNQKFVVVSAGGELTIVAVPAETADLLFMTGEAAAVLVWGADVAVIDELVTGAGGEDMFVPG